MLKRFMPIAMLLLLFSFMYYYDVNTYLTFDTLRENRTFLQTYVLDHFYLSILIFMGFYILAVALSLPGAAVLSITSGFLFGSILGTVLAVISATVGATLVFFVAKTAIGKSLHKRTGSQKDSEWLEKLRNGFQKNSFSYLLSLRLVPLFPFVVVNLASALMGVKIRDFILATFIGIIPGSFVYVSIGTGIGSVFESGGIFSIKSIMTPEIAIALTGLALLSLLPVLIKKIRK